MRTHALDDYIDSWLNEPVSNAVFLEGGSSVRLRAQPSIFMFCLQFKQASVLFARALICFSVIKESLAVYNTLFSTMNRNETLAGA